jgi:alkanesulfonate monooxygenase SsuD/methylene tetrahydromethanopterin reductase-like flavin-dependent oxidoreductase (luciferase family)
MNEQEHFHVNQMTACSFVGSKSKVEAELEQFIDYTQVDELMVTSPIFNHKDKLKSIQLLKEVIDSVNIDREDFVLHQN